MPKYLYDYILMNSGEWKVRVLKVLDKNDKFYLVVNDVGVADVVTISHVDNLEVYNGFCWNCILTKRDDSLAKEFVHKMESERIKRGYEWKLKEAEEFKRREEETLLGLENNISIYEFNGDNVAHLESTKRIYGF